MIPQGIYDHIKYGNGATPKAYMVRKETEYILSRKNKVVTCSKYTGNDSKEIPLSSVPSSVESDWTTYWENEC
jgi:hypothetical protein